VTCNRLVVFSRYSTNKTDHHDITEILLKVVLIVTPTPKHTSFIDNVIFDLDCVCLLKIYIKMVKINFIMLPLIF